MGAHGGGGGGAKVGADPLENLLRFSCGGLFAPCGGLFSPGGGLFLQVGAFFMFQYKNFCGRPCYNTLVCE